MKDKDSINTFPLSKHKMFCRTQTLTSLSVCNNKCQFSSILIVHSIERIFPFTSILQKLNKIIETPLENSLLICVNINTVPAPLMPCTDWIFLQIGSHKSRIIFNGILHRISYGNSSSAFREAGGRHLSSTIFSKICWLHWPESLRLHAT